MGRIIGIDLGTTNSAMAIVKNGKPEILVNANGSRTTPSVVALYNNQIEVGEEAKELMKSGSKEYADGLVHSVKRKMGTDERYNLGAKIHAATDFCHHSEKLKAMRKRSWGGYGSSNQCSGLL